MIVIDNSIITENQYQRNKIKIFFILFFVLINSYTYASISKEDNNKTILSLLDNAKKNIDKNPIKSLEFSNKALQLSKEKNESKLIQESLKDIAEANKLIGNNYEALLKFKEFLNISLYNKDVENEIIAYDNIGELYRIIGDFDQSLEYHLKAIETSKKRNINTYLPLIYNNIGVLYRNIGESSTSRRYYDEALKIGIIQNNSLSIIKSYENIGSLYWYKNQNDSALLFYNKALDIFNTSNKIPISVKTGLLNNIGNAYRNNNDIKKAIFYYQSALTLSINNNNKNLEAVILKNLGFAYFFNKNNSIAIDYFNKSNVIAKTIILKRVLLENYSKLSEIYNIEGDYKSALSNFKEYTLIKDSIFSNEKNIKFSEIEQKYKNKENQEIISTLKYNKQKTKFLYAFILSIISLLLFIATYSRFRLKKIDNKKIEEQSLILKKLNEELKNQNKQLKESKKQILNSETLFRTIFEASPIGIILLDSKGKILNINESFSKIVGIEVNKELYSLNIFQLSVLKRTKILTSFSEVIEKKQVVHGEAGFRNAIGINIIINYHISPLMDDNNELVKIQAVIFDISEKQRNEEALIKSEKQLRELNATKDKFFSIIAHDIKNPFNAIMGFSNLLKEDYESFTDEDRKEFIENISQASEDVYNLLENLLKWSWTQTGKISYNPQNADIQEITNETISVLKLQADRKFIKIDSLINSPILVFADINMLKTVFRNLISNAIKFTNENGNISITYFVEETKSEGTNRNIEIQIADNGIGISKEDIQKLFKIDEKIVSKGTQGESGTGLGLILCKEFIEKNGGQLWVESNLDIGSVFKFTIPLSKNSI